ncbi:MAG: folate-binding protein [Rhodanobacter sp.]|jgi:folate-binding protein YgfZ|nr:folate-binding protein [Rhodanobacter sp.]
MPVPLGPAELIALSGTDALSFAHAQFTSDVRALAAGRWQWSAWLDAQGRVRHFFALLHVEPSTVIAWLPLGGADTMRIALSRFVVRAKVDIQARVWALSALSDADMPVPPAPDAVIAHDGGWAFLQPGPGQRIAAIAPSAIPAPDRAALERWRMDDIAAGLPLLVPELAGEFVAQALDLERFDAIGFDKGCYPGQEVVARLHFRGGNKRYIQRLCVCGAAPAGGSEILDAAGDPIGRVLYAAASSAATTSAALAILTRTIDANTALYTADGAQAALAGRDVGTDS